VIYLNLFVKCFRSAEGAVDHVFVLFDDVTERVNTQRALQQNEEKHRGLLEACPDAIVMADLNGRILFASRQTAELVGLSEHDDLLGQSVFDFVIEGDRHRLAENIPRLLQSGVRRNIEYTVLRQDGTKVPTEISSAITRDATGQPIAIMVVIRDITERKQAAAVLQESHNELQAIYHGMADGCVVFDTELFQEVTINTALCTKLGYSEEEIKALTPEQKHPAYAHSRMREYYQATLQGRKSFIEDVPIFHKDGHLLYFDIATKNISYNGRRCQLLFFHDVTDRKNAEEELRREHRTLKHMLESSDHERQLIAYEIHDELAQQLSGAIMQFQTYSYQKEVNSKLAAKAFDAGMTMLQQGHNETRRLIAGVRPPILDEEGVVAAVHHLVNEERRQRGLQIEFRNDVQFDRLAPILENAIYRIVQEGLTNACQHSKSEKVKVSLLQQGKRIQIEIRDWGIGFDPKAVHENRFGLTGIRQRTRLLGGKCSMRSTTGKGTRITVELPVVVRE
jgi:PAS domain S-box-containing protein